MNKNIYIRLLKSNKFIRHPKISIFFVITLLAAGIVAAVIHSGQVSEIRETTVNVQSDSVNVPATLSIEPSKQNLSYSSPTFKAKYEFNAIAPHWKETDATHDNREVFIRISDNGKSWSEWAQIEAMRPQRDDAPKADQVFPESPLITSGKYFEYKVELKREGDKSPEIKDLSVTYINSNPTKAHKISSAIRTFFAPNKASASTSLPKVISRADWGSPDPTGNGYKGSDAYWGPTFKPTQQIFIHHTVNSDYTSRTDGASVVRAVYQYQANTLGWGDIGYNYLVDQSGNTYQGRAHGDNVVGGHTYEYNAGSMAVALLGCFQPSDSACKQLNPSNQPPSGAMLDSLSTVLAWSTTKFELDPQAKQVFCNGYGMGCLYLYTISGHRDANQTSCPGDLAYSDLQAIRDATTIKKTAGIGFAAKQVNYPRVQLGDNETSVTLQYKNTGTHYWYNSGSNPVRLVTANSTDHASAFAGTGWINSTRPATLNETSVAPGQTGSFTFKLANPPTYLGSWHEYFGLVAEGTTHFGSFFTLPIETRVYSHSYVGQNAYTDSSKTIPLDLMNLSPSQSGWLVLKIKNTSNVTWSNGGSYPVNLGTDEPRNRNSRYCAPGWLNCSRPAKLMETSVAPDSIGTFEFPIKVPAGGGIFKEYFTPIIENLTWMNSNGIYYNTNVNSNYSWQFEGQATHSDSGKVTPLDTNNLSPGQSFFFSVTAKNTGNTIWYRDGSYPLRLGTAYGLDRNSLFYNNTWLTPSRMSAMKETSVSPGQNATFEATFITPPSGGVSKEYFMPVAENIQWLNDLGLYLPVNIKDVYSWEFAGQQAYTDATRQTPVDTFNLAKGQKFYFVARAKNTGTATWYNSGAYPLKLGTSHPLDRTSLFYDSSWLSPNRVSLLKESTVKPGETGELAGYFTAPNQVGSYKEYLQPVTESVTWLNDLGLYIPIVVKD